jgi:hypothetical protein
MLAIPELIRGLIPLRNDLIKSNVWIRHELIIKHRLHAPYGKPHDMLAITFYNIILLYSLHSIDLGCRYNGETATNK